mmetsp:Transcript_988/g.1878  ORF Transcript_988/g.1878 Transcript_988/m.1878 type:complete len:488 (+) Transcript_988:1829-3292(+)
MGGDGADPGVVLIRVLGERREEFDNDAGRDLGVEKSLDVGSLDAGLLEGVLSVTRENLGVVLGEDLLDLIEVIAHVVGEDRTELDHVLETLADLRLATTRNSRGLVQVGALSDSALEVPLLVLAALGALLGADVVAALLDHLDLVPAGEDVGDTRRKVDLLVAEGHTLVRHAEHSVLRHIEDVGVGLVDCVALRLHFDGVAKKVDNILEGSGRLLGAQVLVRLAEECSIALGRHLTKRGRIENLTEVKRGEGNASTGMLFLGKTMHVGGVPELGLDLLLAVSEVVVGDDSEGDSTSVAARQLERAALVVQVVVLLVVHAILDLALVRLRLVGEAKLLGIHAEDVRSEDHAARDTSPVLRVKSSVVFSEVGVVAVAKDGLDEVKVGSARSRDEEASLRCPLGHEARNLRVGEGAQQQSGEDLSGLLLISSVGQGVEGRRRLERLLEDTLEGDLGHELLVSRGRKAAIDDVENSLGGALVAGRVVHNTL